MKHTTDTGCLTWFLFLFGLMFVMVAVFSGIMLAFTIDATPVLLIAPLVFGIVGLFFTVRGIALLARAAARRKQEQWLRSEGQLLEAKYLDCEPDYAVMVNGMPLCTLRCEYTDAAGTQHLFTRKNVLEDPLPFLGNGVVKVYCKRDDWNLYFVDVEGSYSANFIEH